VIVERVRAGEPMRAVARDCRVSLSLVQRWVSRAASQPLEGINWADRSHTPHRVQRTPATIEALVLTVRRELKDLSALGEYGDMAIHRELVRRRIRGRPAIRTIGRILARYGTLDGRRRFRRPAPPSGWYLPEVAARRTELDSVDAIEDLTIEGGTQVDILTCVSLHGGLAGAWPGLTLTTKRTLEALVTHWQAFGLPGYVQFDNDPRFLGGQRYPNNLGRLVQACVSLGVVPVFVPPRESGFQAAVEGFNGRWQAKVWHRFHHPSLTVLSHRSDRYLAALRRRLADRLESAPSRRRFPARWRPVFGQLPQGRLVLLRRTDERGQVEILGRRCLIGPSWPHRLVRCEVGLTTGRADVYALRRQEPAQQPLLLATRGQWHLHLASG